MHCIRVSMALIDYQQGTNKRIIQYRVDFMISPRQVPMGTGLGLPVQAMGWLPLRFGIG